MYSNTSNSYWKERQNKTNRSPLLIATLVVIALAVGTLLHRRNSTSSQYNNDILTQRRTTQQTTDEHWKRCESQVDSKKECTNICLPERNSIQRKTVHQESPRYCFMMWIHLFHLKYLRSECFIWPLCIFIWLPLQAVYTNLSYYRLSSSS